MSLFKKIKSGLFLLAGPCVIENEKMLLETAGRLKEITEDAGMPFVFKSSFDKANRTSIDSFRGPGIDKGLDMLSEVKKKMDVKIVTDVHIPEEVGQAAEVADIIQI